MDAYLSCTVTGAGHDEHCRLSWCLAALGHRRGPHTDRQVRKLRVLSRFVWPKDAETSRCLLGNTATLSVSLCRSCLFNFYSINSSKISKHFGKSDPNCKVSVELRRELEGTWGRSLVMCKDYHGFKWGVLESPCFVQTHCSLMSLVHWLETSHSQNNCSMCSISSIYHFSLFKLCSVKLCQMWSFDEGWSHQATRKEH